MKIRKADIDKDFDQIRSCLIELQDFERQLDSRMPAGEAIADAYVSEMIRKCEEHVGAIFVAEVDGFVCGYVTILTKVRSGALDDDDIEYSQIDDLAVRASFRRKGLGRKLIETAEKFAKSHRAQWLRLSVVAQNRSARLLYAAAGYSELYVDLEKNLTEI